MIGNEATWLGYFTFADDDVSQQKRQQLRQRQQHQQKRQKHGKSDNYDDNDVLTMNKHTFRRTRSLLASLLALPMTKQIVGR